MPNVLCSVPKLLRRLPVSGLSFLILSAFGQNPLHGQKSVYVFPNMPWTNTGLSVTSGDTLSVTATGQLNFYTIGCPSGTTCIVGPDGSNPGQTCAGYPVIAPSFPCNSLIGRIGPNGPPFAIGSSIRTSLPLSGELYLGVNDSNFLDNTLGWTATVLTFPPNGNPTYSMVDDFSLKTNPNGPWSYIIPGSPSTNRFVGSGPTVGLIGWSGPLLAGGALEGVWRNQLPNDLTFLQLVVPPDHLLFTTAGTTISVRFTAPSSSSYSIAGDFLGISITPSPHNVSILVNGTQAFTGILASYKQSVPFTFTQVLKTGDVLEFVNQGGLSATGDFGCGLAAIIKPVSTTTSITSNGIVSASAFGGFTTVSPGSFVEIYGSNLATNSRSWGGADFTGNNAPIALDGTSATIDGQAAFINFISPGQINVQVPSNVAPGQRSLIVKSPAGSSSAYTLNVAAISPGILAPSSFIIGGKQYAVALFSDNTYVLPTGAIPGVASKRAKPGDVIVLYGLGFGPVTPLILAGQIAQQTNSLVNNLQVSIGGMPATIVYAGLAPGYVGLYQLNLVVPNIAPSDIVPLTFTLGGTAGTQTLFLAVQN